MLAAVVTAKSLGERAREAANAARRDAGDEGDDDGDRGEPRRHRHRLGEQLVDGDVAPEIARPEIAAQQRAEIVEILPPQRFIEFVDPSQVFEHQRIERPLQVEWPSGGGPHQEKRAGDDREQRGEHREEARGKSAEHEGLVRGL